MFGHLIGQMITGAAAIDGIENECAKVKSMGRHRFACKRAGHPSTLAVQPSIQSRLWTSSREQYHIATYATLHSSKTDQLQSHKRVLPVITNPFRARVRGTDKIHAQHHTVKVISYAIVSLRSSNKLTGTAFLVGRL